jgi:outer membrane protein assembly factor BamA
MLIRERFLRNVYGHWYVGLELDYQRFAKVQFDWREGVSPDESIIGREGYSNLGLGLGVVYDTRHNVLNVRHGMLSEAGYLSYNPFWGSTNRLSSLFFDNRAFMKINKRNVLAAQLTGQFLNGDVPFNQLSMIGGEMIMRGYYLGKYRDKKMMAMQVEHRWLPFKFSKRIGGTVFGSAGSISPNLSFDKIFWTAGGGVRVLIFPKRDIYTRLDVGFSPEGHGFYIYVGEAF